jgi:hypothetical protein
MAMATDETTYRVELRFQAVGGCEREQLETMAVDVDEAVDQFTSDAVLGSATGASFDPPVVELDLLIRAATPAELHRVLVEVLETIQAHTDVEIASSSSYAETTRPEQDLVPA